MVTLLRIAAILLLVVSVVVAVEGLPQGVDPATHGNTVVQCLLQDQTLVDVTPPVEGEEGAVGEPPAEGEPGLVAPEVVPEVAASLCNRYYPSLRLLIGGVLAALLFGGFASLLYNVKRSREVMERFDDSSQATR